MGNDDTTSGQLPEEASVVIRTLDNVIEAELAQDALRDADIDFAIEPFRDSAWDGALTIGKGWGRVRVAPEDRERAEAVLAAALSPPEELSGDRSASSPGGA